MNLHLGSLTLSFILLCAVGLNCADQTCFPCPLPFKGYTFYSLSHHFNVQSVLDLHWYYRAVIIWPVMQLINSWLLNLQPVQSHHVPLKTHCCHWRCLVTMLPGLISMSNTTTMLSMISKISILLFWMMTWTRVKNHVSLELNMSSFFKLLKFAFFPPHNFVLAEHCQFNLFVNISRSSGFHTTDNRTLMICWLDIPQEERGLSVKTRNAQR